MGKIKNAFDMWLKDASGNNVVVAGVLLARLLMENSSKDNLVWDLLEQTGEVAYTEETFRKAAQLCLDKPDNPGIAWIG